MTKIGDKFIYSIFMGEASAISVYCGDEYIWPGSDVTQFVLNDGSHVNRRLVGTLTQADVPDGVATASIGDVITLIGDSAFMGKGVQSVYIPDTVTNIRNSAFYGCMSLSAINLPSKLPIIDKFVFKKTGLLSVELPDGVTSIRFQAFCECPNLSAVSIPASVSTISEKAFTKCTSLISIDLPGVKTIGPYAFGSCPSLTAVEFSDQLAEIRPGAFEWCVNLSDVKIPNSVASIGYYAFRNCNNMAVFDFGNTRTTVPVLDNVNAFQNVYSNYVIVVPDALYGTWISETNWSSDEVRPHIVKWSDYNQTT